jgi:ribonuclease BN (tRNA processing enzyme)
VLIAETAAQKYHLTAGQAGALARQARAKRIVPFHFSPKYKSDPHVLAEEAMTAFREKNGVSTSGAPRSASKAGISGSLQ